MASLHEVEEHWSMEDVIMANLQLTYSQRLEQDAHERAVRDAQVRAK